MKLPELYCTFTVCMYPEQDFTVPVALRARGPRRARRYGDSPFAWLNAQTSVLSTSS